MTRTFLILLTALVPLAFITGFKSDKTIHKAEAIEWLTMEQAYAKMQKEPKKIMIDVYTDWCGWCKVMDRQTFSDPKVAAYVRDKFYAVKFNAEQKEPITIGDHTFNYSAENKVNELALALTNNQLSFPTTVFLDDKFQMIQPLAGYMKAKEFHEVITFFGENYHKKEAFEDYKAKTYGTLFAKK